MEGARQAGDTCLNDRECASPLRCELTPAGAMRCVQPVRVDAAVADIPATDVVDAPPAPDLPPTPDLPPASDLPPADAEMADAGARD